jgi:hypothetical protein
MTGNTIEPGNTILAFVDAGATGKTNLRISNNAGGINPNSSYTSTVAAATTIAPTSEIVNLTGTTAIATITVPVGMQATGTGGCLTFIPASTVATTTAGNIQAVYSLTANTLFNGCWNGTKWFIK